MIICLEICRPIRYNSNMNKKKYFACKLPIANYVIMAAMCAVMIVILVLSVLRLAEVGNMVSYNMGLDIACIVVAAAATLTVVLTTVLTRYELDQENFVYRRLRTYRLHKSKLLLLRKELNSGMLLLYYMDDKAQDGVAVMVLMPKNEQQLVTALRELNPRLQYELFDGDKEKNHE